MLSIQCGNASPTMWPCPPCIVAVSHIQPGHVSDCREKMTLALTTTAGRSAGPQCGLGGASDDQSVENDWVMLDCCFGIPLFHADVNRQVCERVASQGLCSKDRWVLKHVLSPPHILTPHTSHTPSHLTPHTSHLLTHHTHPYTSATSLHLTLHTPPCTSADLTSSHTPSHLLTSPHTLHNTLQLKHLLTPPHTSHYDLVEV